MTKDEALKLALKALEHSHANEPIWKTPHREAITASKEALAQPDAFEQGRQEGMKQERALWELSKLGQEIEAQPEQEPVVWMYQDKSTHEVKFQKHMRGFVDHGATYETPLYTSPPPQRTWVGLTEQDIDIAFDDTQEGGGFDDFARAIEAKLKAVNGFLKEKNT